MTLICKTFNGCFHNTPILSDTLFDELSTDSRKSLEAITQRFEFGKNKFVIEKGDLPDIYTLIEGQAKAIFFNQINQKEVSKLIEKNEIIGLTETIANRCFRTTIKTNSTCIFTRIKQNDFMRFLYDQPDICFSLIKTLSLNLNKSCQTFSLSTF